MSNKPDASPAIEPPKPNPSQPGSGAHGHALARRHGEGPAAWLVTLLCFAGAALSILIGARLLTAHANNSGEVTAATPIAVSVTPVRFHDSYQVQRRFLGRIEASRTARLTFDSAGMLVEVLVAEGDAVDKGDVLAYLDTRLLEAEQARLAAARQGAKARLAYAEQAFDRNGALLRDDFSSSDALDQSLANRDEALAAIAEIDARQRSLDVQGDKAALLAPFAGIVSEVLVEIGESVSPAQAAIRLVDTTSPEFRVGLPVTIDPETHRSVNIRSDERSWPATLKSVRPELDPRTLTQQVVYQLTTDALPIIGMSGTLTISEMIREHGSWVPISAIEAGTDSLWQVLVLDDDNIVRNGAIEILHAESDRVYVRSSLLPGTRLIDRGPQRVTPGQRVDVVERHL